MVPMPLADFLAAACPTIGTLGSAFYFVPETLARGRELGLDGYRFYFLGRGGVLGDAEAPVVASAFGYFEPGVVAHLWDSARQVVPPREAAREYLGCAHAMGRRLLAEAGDLGAFCAAARAVADAADVAALALFAGVRGEPLPDEDPARAMQLLVALRELRGSAHLVAVRAVGLPPKVAHYLRRPDDYALFGWEDSPPTVGEQERQLLADADELTDRIVGPAFSVLDEGGRQDLLDGLGRIGVALGRAAAG